MPPKTERFEMRMDGELLAEIDSWRKKWDVSRAEAIRMLVKIGLLGQDHVSLGDLAEFGQSKSKKARKARNRG